MRFHVINHYIYFSYTAILEELVSSKRLAGSLSGATYIPDIYTKSQNTWVDSFYKQNGYLGKSQLYPSLA